MYLFTKKALFIFEIMKKYIQNDKIRKIIYWFIGICLFLLLMDVLVLPWYVSSPETKVPKVTSMTEEQAIKAIKDADLTPIVSDTTFDENIPKGSVILQKPHAGETVKTGRRIYLFISSGEPVVKVPMLTGKSVRDAKLTLERIGLKLGNVSQVPSGNAKDLIFDQQYALGTPLKKGDYVSVTVSAGEVTEGEIEVPDLIGKSLAEAEKIITESSLTLGKINYQKSFSLLPNTILDQYPSKGNKVSNGTKVDLFVTKSGDEKKEVIE